MYTCTTEIALERLSRAQEPRKRQDDSQTCPATRSDPGRREHAQMSMCRLSIYVLYTLRSHGNNATLHEEICRCLKLLNASKRGGGRSAKRGTVPSCSGSR